VAQNVINTYMPLPNGSFSGGQNYQARDRQPEQQPVHWPADPQVNDKNSIFIHYIYGKRDFPDTGYEPNSAIREHIRWNNAALQYLPHLLAYAGERGSHGREHGAL